MAEFHENLASYDHRDPPSIRAFGITFAVIFAIIGLFPVIVQSGGVRWWCMIISAGFVAVSYLVPDLLKPLNRLWFRLGMVLHRVVNPIVLAFLFVVVITPVALVLRLIGKRLIDRGFDASAESYWIRRDPPGPAPESMQNQF